MSCRWQTDYLFSISRVGWVVHVGVVLMTWWGVGSYRPQQSLLPWLIVMLAASSALLVLGTAYRRTQDKDAVARAYGWAHTVTVAVIGLAWGVGSFALHSYPANAFFFYTVALGGTALGAVSSQHSLPRSCLVSIWTSVPLLAFSSAMNARLAGGAPLMVMILLYALILTAIAMRLYHFVRSNASMQDELTLKIEQLQATNLLLEEARSRAEKSEHSKSALLAQASHELRQPIHAIAMFAETLRSEVGSEQGSALIDRIESSIRSLSRMFRSFLDLSALDAGAVTPRPEAFSLDGLFSEAVRQTETLALDRGAAVRSVGGRVMVESDPALLLTMVQNLVSNAIKYGGQRVLLGCRRAGGSIRIEVHDNGRGLSRAETAKIFDEYVRLEPHGRRRIDGVGLGLSITRRTAELLNLSVGVRSTPGRGTLFHIDGLSRCAAAPPLHAPPLQQGAQGMAVPDSEILLIDDDDDAREALHAMLAGWGCRVHSLAAPPEPLPAETGRLLLIDQDLGVAASGFDIALQWRKEGGRVLAIITGILSEKLEAECKAHHIPLLVKPAMPAQIRSLLLSASRRDEG